MLEGLIGKRVSFHRLGEFGRDGEPEPERFATVRRIERTDWGRACPFPLRVEVAGEDYWPLITPEEITGIEEG